MNFSKIRDDLYFILASWLFTLPTFLLLIPAYRQNWFIYAVVIINYGLFSIMLIAILKLYTHTLMIKTQIDEVIKKFQVIFKKP